MFYFYFLIVCLLPLPRGQTDPRTSTRRYKPIIQVTEEIDINDITFTTSAPEFERSSSHKASNYYKADAVGKAGYGRLSDTSPSVFPHVYKDSYGAVVPVEKIYTTVQPLVIPAFKYKPYKVIKVQDGYKPGAYKAKGHDIALAFDRPTTFSSPEIPKQLLAQVVPFSSQPTRASFYSTQDSKNFIPSPTFSPTVLAHITNEKTQRFSEHTEIAPFTTQKVTEWPKPTKRPYHIKTSKKILENHQPIGIASQDFKATSEKLEENLSPSALYKESPQESESFLSEISILHKGGNGGNSLDEVADSLDLKTGERVEFQMYGMDGPQSYKFGFDTGKGHNRHFRFEERDNAGKVKGHYGYLDEDGKMRIMKYEADPITGFHAGPVEVSQDDN